FQQRPALPGGMACGPRRANWTYRFGEINILYRFAQVNYIDNGLSSPGVGAAAGPDSPPSIGKTGRQDRSLTTTGPAPSRRPRLSPRWADTTTTRTQIHALNCQRISDAA